jgi:SpoVK/Ycf46/Vps4 family AAA+-type ATPase
MSVMGDLMMARHIAVEISNGKKSCSIRDARILAAAFELADKQRHATSVTQLLPLPNADGNAEAISLSHPTTTLDEMVLDGVTRERLERILLEQRSREILIAKGLQPSRKVLVYGPPGTGKTMCASVLACSLDLPLMRVETHQLLKQYLGETGKNIARVFERIRATQGVYLFDEFDAIALERGNAQELGEMKRAVASLLQFIENDTSESIIIAATNHQDLVDRAMFRRFDEVIQFPMPSKEHVAALIGKRIGTLLVSGINLGEIRFANGLGHADIVAACNQVAKDHVLANRCVSDPITTMELESALDERRRAQLWSGATS